MHNFKLLSELEKAQRRHQRALKKQARRREKRRGKIMAELTDPFVATFYDGYVVDHGADGQVPLALVPTRQLRQRVRALNVETSFFTDAAPAQDSSGGPQPNSEDPPLATSIDPVPATRVPRRRGRQASPCCLPLLPMMPDQGAILAQILKGTFVFPVETGLGRRHRCPRCPKITAAIDAGPLTLHVFPTSAGDLVFRCHRCGFCLDSVEFVHKSWHIVQPLVDTAALLAEWGYLSQPLPSEQLAGYERLAELRILLADGRRYFAAARNAKGRRPPLFGDWALLSVASLRRLFVSGAPSLSITHKFSSYFGS